MALAHLNFESEHLHCNTDVNIILPDRPRSMEPEKFYQKREKYRVLWLLHGTYGDYSDWVRRSNIETYACEKNLMVVMPSALNSNYANWEHFSLGFNMYDYFLEELMPLIYGWFPASRRREDNFIAGLSMGGRGVGIYAFNHPEKFAAAAVLSASPRELSWLEKNNEHMWMRTLGRIENRGGREAFEASYEYTWRILEEAVANHVDLPRLYFVTGSDDAFKPAFDHFRSHAAQYRIPAVFEEISGFKHEWRFWDLAIQRALTFFGLDEAEGGNPY